MPQKKLVMGLPFYGRTWASPSLASAWYFSGVNRIMNENNAHTIQREDGIPYFTFTTTTKVTGYFEDTISLVNRCRMYQSMSVRKIAFWRIGQEDSSFWPWLIACLSSLVKMSFMITLIFPPCAMKRAKPLASELIALEEKKPNPRSNDLLSIRASVKNSLGS
jgi:hypothetical protein